MSRSFSLPALLAAAALFLTAGAALAPAASAQATRTWVSGVGDDVNPCSRTAPCKTFAGAISKTAAGGEINAIDSAGFGAVTITKAITIDTRSVSAGILYSALSGVIVNAGVNDDVVLRGLNFNGLNTGVPCQYATTGVRVVQAGSVRIEDSTIDRTQKAIDIVSTNPVDVFVNRVGINNSCLQGINVAPAASGSANVTIQDSTIANSGMALSVADRAKAWLTRTTVFGNAVGLKALGTGVINDYGDNRLIANVDNGAATNDLGPAKLVQAAPGATGATGPQGPQGPQGEPAIKLLLAASQSTLAGKAGKQVVVSYAATAPATSTLTVLKGSKKIATVTGTSKAGANSIRWNGKAGTKVASTGAYKLVVTAVSADGQTATTTVALKLKRR